MALSIKDKMLELGYEEKDIDYKPAASLELLYKLHNVTDKGNVHFTFATEPLELQSSAQINKSTEWAMMRSALEESAAKNRDFRSGVITK